MNPASGPLRSAFLKEFRECAQTQGPQVVNHIGNKTPKNCPVPAAGLLADREGDPSADKKIALRRAKILL